MRKNLIQNLLFVALSCGMILGGSALAQTPFDDGTTQPTKKVAPTKTTVKAPVQAPAKISADDLKNFNKGALTSNGYSAGDYKNFLVSFPIIEATITFKDISKNWERTNWFKQILAEHGCQVTGIVDQKTTSTGSFFNKVTTYTATAKIKGRSFVLEAIKNYYGGSLSQAVGSPTAPGDAQLADIVALEMKNVELEKQVLLYSFEVDKQMVARSKVGALSFSEKNRLDALLKDLKENKIPAGKAAISQNAGSIGSKLVDLGQNTQNGGDYRKALAIYEISGVKNDNVKNNSGNCYLGLKEYDSAINQFKSMSSSNYEAAGNGIAEAQHGKGNDREALNSLYNVLNGYGNTRQELEALAKIDKWGLLKRTGEFPEMTGKLSQTYLEKGLLDSSSNKDLAAKDYARAVDIKANGGNKKEASAAILNDYSATLNQNKQGLATARINAGQRFDREREQARQNVNSWENAYNRAVADARQDYDYDVSRKYQELNSAKRDLEYLLSNPPRPSSGGSTTDPYGGSTTDPYAKKATSGSTDPYSSKPSGSSTDPYAKKPSGSSTDPYGSKPSGSNTDPYGSKPSGSNTDPYGSKPSGSNTDPYGSSSGSTTDPYEQSAYNSRVEAARAHVSRLDSEYRWLYANESAYVDEKVVSQARSLQDARATYQRYDSSRRDSFISNDSEVSSYNRAVALSDSNYKTASQMAKAAGY